jgi:hypothetical protein
MYYFTITTSVMMPHDDWYVPCLDNRDADHLAWITSSQAPTLPDIMIQKLSKSSIKPAE